MKQNYAHKENNRNNPVIRLFMVLLLVGGVAVSGWGQEPWTYDFGTETKSHTTGESTDFLPSPETGAGTARVRIGSGEGGFFLEDISEPTVQMRASASSSGSVNKFSIQENLEGTTFYTKFPVTLDNGSDGNWYFFQGTGNTITGNTGFAGADVFSGIRWSFEGNDELSSSYRNGSSWSNLPTVTFEQGEEYLIEIYGNNSSSEQTYERAGINYTLAINKWDLWVDGTRVDGLNKAQLADNSDIDGFTFYGENSTDNAAEIFLFSFDYLNALPQDSETPLLEVSPAELTDFEYEHGEGPSTVQSFTVSGTNLTDDVTIIPPADFEISEDENFADKDGEIVLVPEEGTLETTTIYVRLEAGLDIDEYDGDITVTSDGATSQTVSLSGEVMPPPPGLPYSENFADFVSLATLPNGWEVSNTSYGGDWGTGTGAGLRGNANVLGFQHTSGTGTFTVSLNLVNNTGEVIDELFVSYTGKVERNDQNRYPEWTVKVNNEEVTGLFYSTLDAIDKHTGALITDLNIGVDEEFTLSWSSTRGDPIPGETGGSSRQIGISNVSVKAADSFVLYAAADDASNYEGTWDDGDNEGYGFEPWVLNPGTENGGSAGFFIGDPDAAGISGMSTESFGLFANPAAENGSNFADANREFENPLPVGGTFSVDWGVNWTGGPDGNKGINLYSGGISGTQIININIGEDSDVITIEGSPMFNNYGTEVMTLNFEYLGNGDLRIYGTGRDGSETYDETLTVAGAPDAIRFYASNLPDGGDADNHQPYFDNLKISTDPSGFPPDATIIIKGINVIDTDLEVENIIVEDGSSLQIAPAGKLTVNGTIDNQNNGSKSANGLLIQSDATGTGSLIHHTPGVQATAERYIEEAGGWGPEHPAVDWHMISSPVADQAIGGGWTPTDGEQDYDFFAWDEETAFWLNQKDDDNDIDDFIPGQGYLVAYKQTVTNEFTGELNAGSVGVELSHSESAGKHDWYGWNLLGNPFPSAIDWGQVDRNTYFEDDFAYVWNREKTGGPGYEQIDGDGEGDAFIPANQGFFVLVKDGQNDAEFTFNNDIRVHGSEFMKNNDINPERLIVRLAGETYFDQTTIRVEAGTTFERDRRDALKLFSFAPYVPQLYTYTSNEVMVAVNSIPKIDEEQPINLGMRIPEDGEYSLSLQEISGAFASNTLLLEDAYKDIFHDLHEQTVYVFESEEGDIAERFTLHFSPPDEDDDTTDIPDAGALEARIWHHDNTLFVDNPGDQAELRLYDISGRLMQTIQAGTGQQRYELSLPAGAYIIQSNHQDIQPMKIIIH